MKNYCKTILLGGLAVAGVAAPASAALIEQTINFGSASSPLNCDTPESTALTFQKFDASLGTLTDVIVKLTCTDSASATVVNVGETGCFQDVQTKTTTTVKIGGLGIQNVGALPMTKTWSGTALSDSLMTDGPAVSQTFCSTMSTTAFSKFEANGGGTFDYDLTASSSGVSKGTGPGNGLNVSYTANTYGSIEVDFEFKPLVVTVPVSVPEPGTTTAGIVALAAAGFAVSRSRKKSV